MIQLDRRKFLQAIGIGAAVSATPAASIPLQALEEEVATGRRFWFMNDHKQTREFFHIVGYVDGLVFNPVSPKQDFKAETGLLEQGGVFRDIGWQVDQVQTVGGKLLYRARIVKQSNVTMRGELVPDFSTAGPWKNPAEFEQDYGVFIRRA